MQAIGIIGFSNSGKTTLISRLSECLEARGLRVAIAKHTHHELDKPDTDTALLMSPKRTIVGLSNTKDGKGEAMIHWGHPCFLRDLVPLLDADILLVEGGKAIGWLPRVLCLRTTPELLTALSEGCRALRPELALATYGDNTLPGLPSFTVETLDALVDLIQERSFMRNGLRRDGPAHRRRRKEARRLRGGSRVHRGYGQRAGHRIESLYGANAFRRGQGHARRAQGHGPRR